MSNQLSDLPMDDGEMFMINTERKSQFNITNKDEIMIEEEDLDMIEDFEDD